MGADQSHPLAAFFRYCRVTALGRDESLKMGAQPPKGDKSLCTLPAHVHVQSFGKALNGFQ